MEETNKLFQEINKMNKDKKTLIEVIQAEDMEDRFTTLQNKGKNINTTLNELIQLHGPEPTEHELDSFLTSKGV